MNPPDSPSDRKNAPPIVFYAIVICALVFGAILFGSQYGRAKEHPISSSTTTGASARP